MDQNEYRAKKESGELVDDADLQKETEVEETTDEPEDDKDAEPEQPEDESEDVDDSGEEDPDDLPELSEKEKTAFQKRLEREQKKIREQVEQETEQKFSRHKAVIDLMGGDPEKVEQLIRDRQLQAEAEQLAKNRGWNEEQTKWYIEQQKKDQRLQDLEVQVQINDLKEKPEYAGIQSMKQSIMDKINASKGALSVEEAYWAVGGPKRAEQIKLEAQMRETEKRKKTPRTVITDSQTSTTGEKPLPADVLKDAERMGISPEEARRLMKNEPAKNIDDWRAKRKK